MPYSPRSHTNSSYLCWVELPPKSVIQNNHWLKAVDEDLLQHGRSLRDDEVLWCRLLMASISVCICRGKRQSQGNNHKRGKWEELTWAVERGDSAWKCKTIEELCTGGFMWDCTCRDQFLKENSPKILSTPMPSLPPHKSVLSIVDEHAGIRPLWLHTISQRPLSSNHNPKNLSSIPTSAQSQFVSSRGETIISKLTSNLWRIGSPLRPEEDESQARA